MKKIIFLQLGRYAEILQSLPAIQAMAGPSVQLSLIVYEQFADVVTGFSGVDVLHTLPSDELKLEAEYDLLVNLTFTEPSTYLASKIKAKKHVGLTRSEDGSIRIDDSWSRYYFAQVIRKNFNILHKVDLNQRIAMADERTLQSRVNAGWPLRKVERSLVSGHEVGVYVTSGLNSPTWKAILDKVPAQILSSDCFKNPATLAPFDRIVTCDSDMAALASAYGKQVIYLALSFTRPEETGPYGPEHHVLLTHQIEPESLACAVGEVLQDKSVTVRVPHSKTVFKSCVDGSLRSELVPQNFEYDEVKHFFSQTYFLLAEFRNSGRTENLEIPKFGKRPGFSNLDFLLAAHDALGTVRRLAEYGRHYCLKMLGNSDDKIALKEWMGKLTKIEDMLADLRKNIPYVRPLIDQLMVNKDVRGDGIVEVLELTEGSYRELIQDVEIVLNLMEVSVNASKPKGLDAVQSRSELGHENDTH